MIYFSNLKFKLWNVALRGSSLSCHGDWHGFGSILNFAKLIKIQIGAKSVPVNVTPQTGNHLAHKEAHLMNWGRVSKVKV